MFGDLRSFIHEEREGAEGFVHLRGLERSAGPCPKTSIIGLLRTMVHMDADSQITPFPLDQWLCFLCISITFCTSS